MLGAAEVLRAKVEYVPPQAKVPGGQSHSREDGDQVHLDDANAMPDGGGEIVPIAVRHGEPVIAERQMELALFEGLAIL